MADSQTSTHDFYQVRKAASSPTDCACDACAQWTVAYREYGDTEVTELSQSWQGSPGKKTAEDICDLMNMAYEQALELPPPTQLVPMLDRLRALCTCHEGTAELCTFCDAREQIEAQARTLNLCQGRMADLQRRAQTSSPEVLHAATPGYSLGAGDIDAPRLITALRELSKAFVEGQQGRYGMRIPAEPYRDGDLVCGAAARLIEAATKGRTSRDLCVTVEGLDMLLTPEDPTPVQVLPDGSVCPMTPAKTPTEGWDANGSPVA